MPLSYWKASPDFPGIDGALFLFDEQDVYAIQMTISSTHRGPQPGLNKLHQRVLFIRNKFEQSETMATEYFNKLFIVTSGNGRSSSQSQINSDVTSSAYRAARTTSTPYATSRRLKETKRNIVEQSLECGESDKTESQVGRRTLPEDQEEFILFIYLFCGWGMTSYSYGECTSLENKKNSDN